MSSLWFVKDYNYGLHQASSRDTFGNFVQFFVVIYILFPKVAKENVSYRF